MATGWLGWSPKVALSTPLPQIHVALRARIKWISMQNGVPDEPDSKTERIKQTFRRLKAVKNG